MKAMTVGAAVIWLALQAGMAMAQAGCPTAADLARGIRIDFADGSFETYRDTGAGVVVVDGADPEGFGYQMELGHGIHLLSYVNVNDGVVDDTSRISYDYGRAVGELPLPEAGGRWSSPVTVNDQYGPRSEPQTHQWSQISTVDIGGCSYDMIEAIIGYKTGDGYRESVEYLPELGLGYLLWNESDTMARNPVRPVSIRVAGKK